MALTSTTAREAALTLARWFHSLGGMESGRPYIERIGEYTYVKVSHGGESILADPEWTVRQAVEGLGLAYPRVYWCRATALGAAPGYILRNVKNPGEFKSIGRLGSHGRWEAVKTEFKGYVTLYASNIPVYAVDSNIPVYAVDGESWAGVAKRTAVQLGFEDGTFFNAGQARVQGTVTRGSLRPGAYMVLY